MYNDILKKFASEEKATVNDLYSVIAPIKEQVIGEDHLHLTPEGIETVADQTARILHQQLTK